MSEQPTPTQHLIDITSMLRVLSCRTCGVGYAAPMSLWLQRSHDREEIFCPSGHAHRLAPDDEAPESMQLLNLLVAGELENVQMQLASALIAANRAAPAEEGPISKTELKRRSEMLASKCRLKVCRFCGKEKGGGLASHYRRQHAEQVAKLPARMFD